MEKLTIKETMKRLNLAETTIRRMMKRGDLPNYDMVNRKIWIPLSDIEAYEQQQDTTTPPNASETPHVSPSADTELAKTLQNVEEGAAEDAVPTFTVKETMARLKISRATIRRMISRGEFPNLERKDRKIYIPLDDIEAYTKRKSAQKRRKTSRKSPSSLRKPTGSVPLSHDPGASAIEGEVVSEPVQDAPRNVVLQSVSDAKVSPEVAQKAPESTQERSLQPDSSDAEVETDGPDTSASSGSVSPSSEAVNTSEHHEESLKRLAIQAGMIMLKGLEHLCHTLILGLERYQE